jgi:TrmH family RNA methyltransferase
MPGGMGGEDAGQREVYQGHTPPVLVIGILEALIYEGAIREHEKIGFPGFRYEGIGRGAAVQVRRYAPQGQAGGPEPGAGLERRIQAILPFPVQAERHARGGEGFRHGFPYTAACADNESVFSCYAGCRSLVHRGYADYTRYWPAWANKFQEAGMNTEATRRFRAVLCRAEGAINVGSCCRALKTMGYESLSLADCPSYDEDLVRSFALASYDIYEKARRYPTLEEALSGAGIAVGLSRRQGKKRKESLPLMEFAASYADYPGTVAMVFGNERDGLSDRELSVCDLAVYIPSSELFPSLNLSHALQLTFWELRRAGLMAAAGQATAPGQAAAARPATSSLPAAAARNDSAAARSLTRARAKSIADKLQASGFYKIAGRPESEAFLAELMARACLSEAEADRFEGLFSKLAALEAKRP